LGHKKKVFGEFIVSGYGAAEVFELAEEALNPVRSR
jgi:hypothetical protein